MKKRTKPRRRKPAIVNDVADFKSVAPYVRRFFDDRGTPLPFYDFLDSYKSAFDELISDAMERFQSLVGVNEVSNQFFFDPEKRWMDLWPHNMKKMSFTIDDKFADYVSHDLNTSLSGSVMAFRDQQMSLRTGILIRKDVRASTGVLDHNYVLKIASLAHEMGHVHDAENEINLRYDGSVIDVVEAEIYANLFALELLAERNMVQSYEAILDAMTQNIGKEGYVGEVTQAVLDRNPQRSLTSWMTVIANAPKEEVAALGPEALNAFAAISED